MPRNIVLAKEQPTLEQLGLDWWSIVATVSSVTFRMRVHEGWLVKTVNYAASTGGTGRTYEKPPGVALVFVSDPDAVWDIPTVMDPYHL